MYRLALKQKDGNKWREISCNIDAAEALIYYKQIESRQVKKESIKIGGNDEV